MKTLEERIEKVKQDYELELAEIKAGEEIKKEVNFERICRHVYLADYVVTMPKMDFRDAMTEIEKLNPINVNLIKGIFISFVPEFSLDEYTKKEEKHIKTVDAIGGYYYKVSHFGNKLSCFKEIAVQLINKTGYFTHSVKWSTGSREYPNDFTLYV
jgi:hypothetical protein